MVIAQLLLQTLLPSIFTLGVQVYLTIMLLFITFDSGFIGVAVQNTHRFEFWKSAFGDKKHSM
jgi:hypothetical protein